MVPLVASEHSERDETPADTVHVAQFAVDVEALLEQRAALRIVSLLGGEPSRRLQGLGAGAGTSTSRRERKQGRRPLPPLREVTAAAPETPERTGQAQAVVGRPVVDEPGEGRAQVVVVLFQVIQPLRLPPSSQEARLGLLGQLEIAVGMGAL